MTAALRSLWLFAVLALGGCFSPDQPDCSFRCDDEAANHNRCPDNYTCQAGYCRLNGSSAVCGDLGAPADLSPGADLATQD